MKVSPLPAAPGQDEHPALDLANTVVVLPGGRQVDLLGSPHDATRWLVARALAPESVELHQVCTSMLHSMRDQVRQLLAAAAERSVPPAQAVDAVNHALTAVPAAALLRWDGTAGPRRVNAHPVTQVVEHALAVVAADAAELVTGPESDRIAACAATPCDRYLLRTHARRQWCSTRCGDRVRAARAYARRVGRADHQLSAAGP